MRNENWVSPWTGDGAYLDRVVYRFFDGAKDSMIAAFLAGEIDVATDLLQGDYAAIAASTPPSAWPLIAPAWEYEHFDFNQAGDGPGEGHPALTDPNVRMALAHAIDKAELYETVYPGIPMPEDEPCSPVPPGLYFRTTEGLTCIEYDPAKAVELLDASGWVDSDGDGIRDKDGVKLSLLHCHTGAGFRVAAGDYLASKFRDIGVELINTAAPETVFAGWNEVAAGCPVQPDPRQLRHGRVRLGELLRPLRQLLLPSTTPTTSRPRRTAAPAPTTPGSTTRRWTRCSTSSTAPPTRPRRPGSVARLQRLHTRAAARGRALLPEQRPRRQPQDRQLPPEPGHRLRHVEHR